MNIDVTRQQTPFEILNNINVNDFCEIKNNGSVDLKYLSWSKAWEVIKTNCPDASYEIERFENNLPYVYDEKTGYMVFTKVTIDGVTHEMWLPVMNGANKAMKAEPYTYLVGKYEKTVNAATMFDINTTIMRCLTKNLAMFGLGLYIYSGEDIPHEQQEQAEALEAVHITTLKAEMKRTGITEKSLFYTLGIKSWEDMRIKEFRLAMDKFQNTPDKAKK